MLSFSELIPQTRDRFWKRAASIRPYTDLNLASISVSSKPERLAEDERDRSLH